VQRQEFCCNSKRVFSIHVDGCHEICQKYWPSAQKKKKKKKKIHKTCLLIGRGSFVATKNFQEKGPPSVSFHWKTSCIPLLILCMDLGFEEMAHLGSIGVWAYYKEAKTWVEDMIGLSFRNLLEFGVPTCLGAGEGAVDWVVGTYWKDRRTLFFPLKREKICQIRSDWQLSGVLAKEVIRACTVLQGPCSDSICPLILYYIYTKRNLTGFFFRIWKLSTLSKQSKHFHQRNRFT
jgi:hypothetical protein